MKLLLLLLLLQMLQLLLLLLLMLSGLSGENSVMNDLWRFGRAQIDLVLILDRLHMIGSNARRRGFARRCRMLRRRRCGRANSGHLLLLRWWRKDGVVEFLDVFVLDFRDAFVLDLDYAVFAENPDSVLVAVRGNHVAAEVGRVAEIFGANLAVESVLVVRRHDVAPQIGRVRKLLTAFAAHKSHQLVDG